MRNLLAGTAVALTFAAVLASHQLAAAGTRIQSVVDMAKVCQQRGKLLNEIAPLEAERAKLKQIVTNLGFQDSAAYQDGYEQRVREIEGRRPALLKDFEEVTIDQAKFAAEAALKEMIRTNAKPTERELEFLLRLTKNAPRAIQDSVGRLSDEAGRAAAYGRILGWSTRAFDIYKLANTDDEKEFAWKTIMLMADVANPAFGLLLKEADFAAKALIDNVTLRITSYQIDKLSTMTERDLQTLKKTADQMTKNGTRLGALRKEMAALPPCDSTQMTQSTNPSGSGIGAKSMLGIVSTVGAVIGTAVAYTEYKKSMAETDALLSEFSSIPTGSGSSTSSPAPTTGVSTYNGTYRAQVTRSCVAGGFPASCQQAPELAGCSPTNFILTVSNGTIRDCGSNLTGTVQSNGTYSGFYTGSAGGVPISGRFQSSGTFLLQGQANIQGSSYTVRVNVTRQ